MKNRYLIICSLLALVLSISSHAKSSNNISWSGNFFIDKANGDSLVIKREYEVRDRFSNSSGMFSYVLSCSADTYYPEIISFTENNFSIEVNQISLKEDHSVRFNSRQVDKEIIKSALHSTGLNLYNYEGKKSGELSLRGVLPFLEQHQALLSECKENISIELEEKKREEMFLWAAYGAAGLIGVIFAFFFIKFAVIKLRVAKVKAKELSVSVAQNLSERKNKQFDKEIERKIVETAVDEIVRQTVKRAMSEGVDPNQIVICSRCKGAGCSKCSHKGWLVEQ
ncbi:hypothetical protein [Moritella sp. 28]|uniref:hypothetical protein n=1 Tax=Moritella sp. 28 TaxID=2746232 RepID=UPI001BAB0CCE|nr:hypothetical protein [Moritella sp. 28]QUM84588.1 hypothetical protein HWV02_08770 [Moritella sp. 28]